MKLSAMIIATLAAIVAVVPASAINDETFGQASSVDDVAPEASSPNHSLLRSGQCELDEIMCSEGFWWRCIKRGLFRKKWEKVAECSVEELMIQLGIKK